MAVFVLTIAPIRGRSSVVSLLLFASLYAVVL